MPAAKRKPTTTNPSPVTHLPNAQLEGDDVLVPSPEQQQHEREQALLDEIHQMRARLNQLLTEKATELKASRDGAGLPLDWLIGQLRQSQCLCWSVARLLGDPTTNE